MNKRFFPVVTITNKWQSRIEKRRSEGLDVLGFVDALMHGINESFTEPARTEADQKERKQKSGNRRNCTKIGDTSQPSGRKIPLPLLLLFPTFKLKVNSSMF